MIGIYKITSPTKRVYIGQSINIKSRFNAYNSLKGSRYQIKLNKSFTKHGIDNHKFEILMECQQHELNRLERYYQDLYHSTGRHGLNCILTGYSDRSGAINSETREKMSKAKKGRSLSEDHKKALSNAKNKFKNANNFTRPTEVITHVKIHKPWKREPKFRGCSGKEIIQINLNMDIVAIYFNACEAARVNNFKTACSIYQAANGKRATAYSYIWRWKDEVA